MKSAAQALQLTKHFNDFWGRPRITAVSRLDLDVPTGCIFGLLGPNGSGKTTTLKLLTGLLNPSQGTVMIHGAPPRSIAARKRFGYLPEVSKLYGSLNARENLRFFCGLFGISAKNARHRVNDLLDQMDLADAADRPVAEYSKGMQRRAGLALALIHEPDLLILDEPTAGLDPAGCQLVKDLLKKQVACGRSVIISSHLLADIEDICDQVCILHKGESIANGRLGELLEQRQQMRFTVDALTPEKRVEMQAAFSRITGQDAEISHPRMALDAFFFMTVAAASHDKSQSVETQV